MASRSRACRAIDRRRGSNAVTLLRAKSILLLTVLHTAQGFCLPVRQQHRPAITLAVLRRLLPWSPPTTSGTMSILRVPPPCYSTRTWKDDEVKNCRLPPSLLTREQQHSEALTFDEALLNPIATNELVAAPTKNVASEGRSSEGEESSFVYATKGRDAAGAGASSSPLMPFSETVARSAAKTLLWRSLSALITFQTTVIFTQSYRDALRLLLVSFLPKSLTLFILDRAVNRGIVIADNCSSVSSSPLRRSLFKVAAWRALSVTTNIGLAMMVLRNPTQASQIVSADLAGKTLLMIAYEWVWAQISWGKEEKKASIIIPTHQQDFSARSEGTIVVN